MKYYNSISLIAGISMLVALEVNGQYIQTTRTSQVRYAVPDPIAATRSSTNWNLPGFSNDQPSTVYRPTRPHMSLPVNTSGLSRDTYWMGSVTAQSFNQGKFGRYYYWDIQGNLRGSQLFLDIAGKNKRGLKLVFPRHRAIF